MRDEESMTLEKENGVNIKGLRDKEAGEREETIEENEEKEKTMKTKGSSEPRQFGLGPWTRSQRQQQVLFMPWA